MLNFLLVLGFSCSCGPLWCGVGTPLPNRVSKAPVQNYSFAISGKSACLLFYCPPTSLFKNYPGGIVTTEVVSVKSHCTKKPIARRIPGNGLKTIMHCREPERSRAAGPAQHSVELNPSLVQRIRARLGSVTYLSHSQRWSGWGRRSPHCSLRRWVFLQTGNSFCQWQKA